MHASWAGTLGDVGGVPGLTVFHFHPVQVWVEKQDRPLIGGNSG